MGTVATVRGPTILQEREGSRPGKAEINPSPSAKDNIGGRPAGGPLLAFWHRYAQYSLRHGKDPEGMLYIF